ncbi:hypothetical protein [Pseudonocardia sp. ICBG1142]|uniref:hypothetical protein n=1 Tax=Pseudonocardia sp. ICBG1142 TaxID=2846760 RepID=UPI001CF70FF1|nr:hypothetical protein [Pseudonocardia sp. ICBG1142]
MQEHQVEKKLSPGRRAPRTGHSKESSYSSLIVAQVFDVREAFMNAVYSLSSAVRAEIIRWRGSSVARLPWGAVGFGGLATLLALSSTANPEWRTFLAYQNLWVVGFSPLFLALIVGTQASIEHVERGGGTWSRAVTPWVARAARFIVLTPAVFAVNFLAMLIPTIAGIVLVGSPPGARLLLSIVVPALGQLALLAVLVRVGMHAGRLAVLAVGTSWSVAAVVTAEATYWIMSPFAWTLRGALPVIETHANGEGFLPGEPLATTSVMGPTSLSLALAIVALSLPASMNSGRIPRFKLQWAASANRRTAPLLPNQGRSNKSRPIRAIITIFGRTLAWPLAIVAIGAPVLLLRWREPAEAISVLTVGIVPFGAVVLAMLAQGAVAEGARAVATRAPSASVRWRAVITITLTVAIGVVVVTDIIFVGAGLSGRDAVRIIGVGTAVASMLTVAHLWIANRFSVTLTAAIGIAGTVTGLLVAGTVMSRQLWPVVPWAWAHYSESYRISIIVPVALAVTLTLYFVSPETDSFHRKSADQRVDKGGVKPRVS